MRVIIVTSIETGFASVCLPALRRHDVDVVGVVLADAPPTSRLVRLRRIIRKTRRIGLLGALCGVRMRRWYGAMTMERLDARSLPTLCAESGVNLVRVGSINDPKTSETIRRSGAELALCLGATRLDDHVFEAAPRGMLNVHHELLPEYRGAQSVIWSLFDGKRTTGYTIHRVEAAIDGGAILDRQVRPIRFEETLASTVAATYADLLAHSAERLAEIIADFERFDAAATRQGGGRRFTTPSWAAYRTIMRQWRTLRSNSEA